MAGIIPDFPMRAAGGLVPVGAGLERHGIGGNPLLTRRGNAPGPQPQWIQKMSIPLTVLSEDEQLFRESCRSFAQERIQPLVHKMDEEAKLDQSIIPELFDLGLMGIHIPEQFGGSSGSFFMSVLAVEEVSRVDASFGVFIDVQNTLVNNAIMRWAHDD